MHYIICRYVVGGGGGGGALNELYYLFLYSEKHHLIHISVYLCENTHSSLKFLLFDYYVHTHPHSLDVVVLETGQVGSRGFR